MNLKMRKLFIELFCITEVFLCGAEPLMLNEDHLSKLSVAGQKYVDEELKKSLLGVMQVKEKMLEKEEKHRCLMEAVRLGSEKKKGAAHLAKETEGKLSEAENLCRDSTKSSFGKCRPCLEDSCKGFYTLTCRRGFAYFSSKLEDFFRKMTVQLESPENGDKQKREDSGVTPLADKQLQEDGDNLEMLQAEESFSLLQEHVSAEYSHSIRLVKKIQQVSDPDFLTDSTTEFQIGSRSNTQGGLRPSLFGSLDQILESVYDFGKNVLEDSSSVSEVHEEIEEAEVPQSSTGSHSARQYPRGNLCRRLRRQASECWQLQGVCETCRELLLKECSSVQQSYSDLEQMYTLLNASRQQYNDRLQLVHRHTADTRRWLGSMDEKHGWVSRLSGSSVETHNIFRVITQQVTNNRSVVVSVLNSAPLTISIPADVDVDEPAFIHFVAWEAFESYKHQIRDAQDTLQSLNMMMKPNGQL